MKCQKQDMHPAQFSLTTRPAVFHHIAPPDIKSGTVQGWVRQQGSGSLNRVGQSSALPWGVQGGGRPGCCFSPASSGPTSIRLPEPRLHINGFSEIQLWFLCSV